MLQAPPLQENSLEYQLTRLYLTNGGIMPPAYRHLLHKYSTTGVSVVFIFENRYSGSLTIVFDGKDSPPQEEQLANLLKEAQGIVDETTTVKFATFSDF